MFPDTLNAAPCNRTVGLTEALLSGVPEGACVNLALSPFYAFVAIAAIGIVIACLQAVVRALLFGPGRNRPRPLHEPETGLREAANRARARRLAEDTE